MRFQLVVVQGRSATQTLKVGSGVMTVRRQQDCQLRIASSQVSRKHCQIFEKKGLLLVKDLGSSNGTLVNGKKIADQRVLEPGDELTVGSVKFKIERIEDTVLMPGNTDQGTQHPKPGDTAITDSIGGEDDLISLEGDEEPTGQGRAPAGRGGGTKSATRSAVKPAPEDATVEISEDAVADYLLNIELDDDDK